MARKTAGGRSIARLFGVVLLITGFAYLSQTASYASEAHDVKYFFDHIEPYREGLPRFGTKESITARGKLVTFTIQRKCSKRPCAPGRGYGLRDVNDKKYMFQIFETTPFLESLKVGHVYVLNGILEKGVDRGRKKIFIFNFKPQKKIK